MRYQVDRNSKTTAYLQLYEALREDIIRGLYTYGTKLPSKRILAEETGVSVITASHAYELLVEEGYLQSREKSGYFVSYREKEFYETEPDRETAEESRSTDADPSPYPHGAAQLSYGIFAKTMRKTIADYGERILERSPNQGIEPLRTEISRYLARNIGIQASPEQIIIGAGAEYLYSLVAQLLADRKSVAIENPSYTKIRQVYEHSGLTVEALPLGKTGILSSKLSATKAGILHVTPFHSYPSNVTADISKKNEYLDWASKENRILVEDNYDSELTVSKKMENTLYSLSKQENVIFLNTFSKTIAPAVRIGYMVLPGQLAALFRERLGFYSCTVPVFEQYVLYELLRSGDFERHLNKVRRKLRLMK